MCTATPCVGGGVQTAPPPPVVGASDVALSGRSLSSSPRAGLMVVVGGGEVTGDVGSFVDHREIVLLDSPSSRGVGDGGDNADGRGEAVGSESYCSCCSCSSALKKPCMAV